MQTTFTRKQIEMLSVAEGLARGLSPAEISAETGLNPGCVYHFRRRLRHLRVDPDEVANLVENVGPETVDHYLLAMFRAKQFEQKARTKAARLAEGGGK